MTLYGSSAVRGGGVGVECFSSWCCGVFFVSSWAIDWCMNRGDWESPLLDDDWCVCCDWSDASSSEFAVVFYLLAGLKELRSR